MAAIIYGTAEWAELTFGRDQAVQLLALKAHYQVEPDILTEKEINRLRWFRWYYLTTLNAELQRRLHGHPH